MMRGKRTLIWIGIVIALIVIGGIFSSKSASHSPTAASKQTAAINAPTEKVKGTAATPTIKLATPSLAIVSLLTSPLPAGQNLVAVTRVIDGDTIEVEGLGKIRLIGIDTPEVADPRKPVQCFGKEASDKAKALLTNQKVRLESDPTQGDLDKYSRHLRYVYLADGTFFNLYMVKNGFAHEYTYNIPYKYMNEFNAAELEARQNNRGFWAPSTCNGDTTKAASGNIAGSTTSGQCVIKGNISSSGEKIYHVPGGAYYDSTQIDEAKGERWFCTEAEAVAAGWRKSKK